MVYRQRMKYAQETFAGALSESLPLLSEHWGEIARNRELIKLNPDFDLYHKMEALGCIRLYTARTDEGARTCTTNRTPGLCRMWYTCIQIFEKAPAASD